MTEIKNYKKLYTSLTLFGRVKEVLNNSSIAVRVVALV